MNMSNVTFRQLRAFLAVADTGSFASAAARLHQTPSALSLLVRELETHLQVRLFDRNTRSTALSQTGAEFYPLARRVLDDLSIAIEATQDLAQKKRGSVRIACTPLYAATTLPELVQRFRQQYPSITVHILDSLNQQATTRVIAADADFAVAPQRPCPPELEQESVMRDRIHFICRKDHPFVSKKSVTWAQALTQPFVTS